MPLAGKPVILDRAHIFIDHSWRHAGEIAVHVGAVTPLVVNRSAGFAGGHRNAALIALQTLDQALTLGLVDIELAERHASRLDACLHRLDRHNAYVPTQLAHDLLGTLAGLVVAVSAVMG